jgi:hypothetical protein
VRRVTVGAFVAAGLLVAVLLAFVGAPHASSEPDGLNKVAADEGFADQQQAHALEDGPTAGYQVKGVHDDRLSTGLAGVLGVGVTFGLGYGLLVLVRRNNKRDDVAEPV